MTNDPLSTPSSDAPRYTRPPSGTYDDPTLSDPKAREDAQEYVRHQLVNNAIATQLVERLTGHSDYGEVLRGADPSQQFFAGALSSQYDYRKAQEEDEAFKDIAEDVAPFTIGVRFRVPADIPDDATVTVAPRASGYQRRYPSLDEQLDHSNDSSGAEFNYEDADSVSDSRGSETSTDGGATTTEEAVTTEPTGDDELREQELLRVYQRIDIDFDDVTLTGEQLRELRDESSPRIVGFGEALSDAHSEAADIDRRFRERDDKLDESEASRVPPEWLQEKEDFEDYLDEAYPGNLVEPLWDARLEIEARRDTDPDGMEYVNVTARLVNTHGENYEEAEDPEYEPWRANLYDVGVSAEVDGTDLQTFESEEIEDDYRYDGTIYGVGENCAVDPIYADDVPNVGSAPAVGVETRTVPTYRQARYLSRNPDDIAAPFSTLAGDEGRDAVFSTLNDIASAMSEAHRQYAELQDEITEGKSEAADDQYEETLEGFDRERERFETGIEVLRDYERAYQAFTMMNEAFDRLGYDKWRTFQIVYIVMALPDVVAQAEASAATEGIDDADEEREAARKARAKFDEKYGHELDAADVIYFPTGGGRPRPISA